MKTTPTIQAGERTQHTPGPWSIGYVGSIAKAFGGGIFDPERNQIALVAVPRDGSDVTRRANARLIAAAPELLTACKNLLVKHEHPADDVFAEEVARAAIAKAEGRDSTQMSRS